MKTLSFQRVQRVHKRAHTTKPAKISSRGPRKVSLSWAWKKFSSSGHGLTVVKDSRPNEADYIYK
jgi:hypothetical protein